MASGMGHSSSSNGANAISTIFREHQYYNPSFDVTSLTGNQSHNELIWKDGLTATLVDELEDCNWNALRPVFRNGQLLVDEDLDTIRKRIKEQYFLRVLY